MLRTLFPALVLTLAACELQPTPPPSASRTPTAMAPGDPSQAAPPAQPQPQPQPPAQPPAQPTADAGVRPAPTEPCIAIGQHVAAILIAEAPPAQQMAFENDRDKIVRSTADACTAQGWSADALKCYAVANNGAALKQCETRFRPTAAPDAPPPRGGQPAFEAGGGSGSDSGGKKSEPGAPRAETPAKGKATAKTRSDRPATP